MAWMVLGLIVLVVVALLILLKAKARVGAETNEYPYSKQDVLFSPAERSFLGVLTQAVGNDAQIFGKVRVADVITPIKGMPRSDWQKAFNKISGKHFDFLLCDKEDLSIICAIELDDSSHKAKSRIKRDQFLDGACKSSSVMLIQVPAQSSYNISEIRGLFSPYLNSRENFEINIKAVEESPVIKAAVIPRFDSEKVCPKCSSLLVKKIAKKGDGAGNEFWACSSFPKCRYTETVNA